MIFINDSELDQLLSTRQVISIIEQAMCYAETNHDSVPQRMHLQIQENTILVMPAVGKNFYGSKVVSVYPENPRINKPMISGYYVLNDIHSGAPVAVMSAEKLTAIRTGGIGGAAAKNLAPSDTSTLGIIGCGVQGLALARSIVSVLPVKKIFCFSRTKTSIENFLAACAQIFPDLAIEVCEQAEQVVSATEVIVTATTSPQPVFDSKKVSLKGKTFIAIGSYRPQMQELPNEVFEQSSEIIIDATSIRKETGDVLNPVKNGLVKEENVFTLGKLLLGQRKLMLNTRVFKSAGYALFDLFVAAEMYKCAAEKGLGKKFEFN
jgi:ornithine cyclodeaminase/alanine dehydrogenase-like protein (mu-crystallin family)